MTDEELAKLFPNVKWPQTFEGKNGTYIKPTQPPKLSPGFSDLPITKDTPPALSIGTLRNYVPTPRERFLDYLNRTFYGDNREGWDRAEKIARYLDVTPVAIPNAAYETTRAIGEGNLTDAIVPAITAAAPFLGKPAKLLGKCYRAPTCRR